MIRSPRTRRRSVVLAAAVLGAAVLPATAANAAPPSTSDAIDSAWEATHAGAVASGTRWTEGQWPSTTLHVAGALRGPGTGCASVWVRWVYDLAPGLETRIATACDGGTVDVATETSYWPTTTGSLRVCAGESGTGDCGQPISLTTW
ncbi:hypothetical protein [Saccharomonospora piscinae]|uniref:hypothetical protein n=1 Tax=Saccharomonospora piscinae TaxID=687388 RepID=UPI00111C4894|nr:hypothetical protein [Saccharomonospora piscinae]